MLYIVILHKDNKPWVNRNKFNKTNKQTNKNKDFV